MMNHYPIKTTLCMVTMLILTLAMAGCGAIRKSDVTSDARIYINEVNNSDKDKEYRKIHKKLRPLERPQIRYAIDCALIEGDSCWVLLRITAPDKSIRKHERYNAGIALSTAKGILEFPTLTFDNNSGLPDADDNEEPDEDKVEQSIEIDAPSGRPDYAYLSFRFRYHPSMAGNGTLISILPSLETKRYFFQYFPVELPVRWSHNPAMWKQMQQLPQFILLDKEPEYILPDNEEYMP